MKAFLLSLAVLAIVARADWVVQEKMVEACRDGSWEISNAMLRASENATHVVVDTARSDENSTMPTVHEVTLHFPHCTNASVQCENSTVTVKDLDCSDMDLSMFSREVCDVASALAAWERQKRFFQDSFHSYPLINLCITRVIGDADGDLDSQ